VKVYARARLDIDTSILVRSGEDIFFYGLCQSVITTN